MTGPDISSSGSSSSESSDDSDHPGEGIYTVERMLEFGLHQFKNLPSDLSYDPSLGNVKWEVRYRVKWKGYDEAYNSWEPKECFQSWDPTLLQKLQRDHPELGDHALLVADAQKRNRELRRQQANPPAHPSALQRSAQHPSSQHAPSGERPILLPIEVAKPAAPAETSDSGSDYASHCSSNDTASISFESEQAPQRATRPPSKAEFIPLNKDLLQQRLVCVEALRFRKNLSLEEAILRRWGNQNPTQNWEGRECWIYAPEKNKALSKVARGVEEDYTALQFLLANQEAKQVELLQDSTQIVFIHVSEESKLFSSEIYELENLKEKSTDGFAVVVFGMRDLKAKTGVFQQVWSVAAAITITPSALDQDPKTFQDVFKQAHSLRKLYPGRRSHFGWLHASLLLENGPFYLPPDSQAQARELIKLSPRFEAIWALHTLIRDGTVQVAQPAPFRSTCTELSFPAGVDILKYHEESLSEAARWIPPVLRQVDLETIARRVVVWKTRYPQIRQWIIILTDDERDAAPPTPGITYLTLAQAKDFLKAA